MSNVNRPNAARLLLMSLSAGALVVAGCRTATVVQPKSKDTTTVVSVEERPKTQPSEPGVQIKKTN
jgi:hypothetical protein